MASAQENKSHKNTKKKPPVLQDSLQACVTLLEQGQLEQRLSLEDLNAEDQALAKQLNQVLDVLQKRILIAEAQQRETDSNIDSCLQFMDQVRSGEMNARVDDDVLHAENPKIVDLAEALNATLEATIEQVETIRRQQLVIQEMSTPILQVWDSVLVLPVVGVVDSRRAQEMMEQLLQEIIRMQARFVILDVTGMEIVDTSTADHIVKLIKSAELLGATCISTGIRPAVAQTMVEIGLDMSNLMTLRNLEAGLKECLRRMDDDKGSRGVNALSRMSRG